MKFPLFGKTNDEEKVKEKLREEVNYFIKGEDVVFILGKLDFTFEKFYLFFNEEGLFIIIPEEVPMNLINILDTIQDNVDVNRKQVLEADDVNMILQLDPDLYREFKPRILELTGPADVFELDLEGFKFLKELEHYHLIEYGTKKMEFNFHLGGKLGNYIRRKGKF